MYLRLKFRAMDQKYAPSISPKDNEEYKSNTSKVDITLKEDTEAAKER